MLFTKVTRLVWFVFFVVLLFSQTLSASQESPLQSQQIAELMGEDPWGKEHQRFVHAKGIAVQGSLRRSPAESNSRATHFQGAQQIVQKDVAQNLIGTSAGLHLFSGLALLCHPAINPIVEGNDAR